MREPRRRSARDRLAALPGVCAVGRPVTAEPAEAGAADQFDLFYVRTGPTQTNPTRSGPAAAPLVIVPGGPGMASIGHYQGLRRRAAAAGLDVIMVEHRGVGLSRRDRSGADLPPEALTIEQVVDDIAAVLDDAGVDRAVIYGTSYGSYLAAGLGVRHPGRVQAMILDSPLLNADDIDDVRRALRELLWEGEDLAGKVRRLAMSPTDAHIAATLYGLGGEDLLHRHLDLLLDGRSLLWRTLHHFTFRLSHRKVPYHNESDLVGPIGFRELNYAGTPDGLPLDPALAMREFTGGDIAFTGEPFDLVDRMPFFDWPTAVISGGRDLVTPPAVADRITELLPSALLVGLPTAGHSILDTRERAAVLIAAEVCVGHLENLVGQGAALDALPASPAVRLAGSALGVAARLEAALPKLISRVTS